MHYLQENFLAGSHVVIKNETTGDGVQPTSVRMRGERKRYERGCQMRRRIEEATAERRKRL